MSYDFNTNTTAKLNFGAVASPSSSNPNSFAAWIQIDQVQGTRAIIECQNSSDNGDAPLLYMENGGQLSLFWSGSSFSQKRTPASTLTAASSTWVHVCATMDGNEATTGWVIYKNGSSVAGQTNQNGSTLDTSGGNTVIGGASYSNVGFNGRIAFPTVWENYELSAGEVAQLANGAHPHMIAPHAITLSPDLSVGAVDSISGATGTATRADLYAEEPPVFYPVWPESVTREAAAVGGATPKGVFGLPFNGPFGGALA